MSLFNNLAYGFATALLIIFALLLTKSLWMFRQKAIEFGFIQPGNHDIGVLEHLQQENRNNGTESRPLTPVDLSLMDMSHSCDRKNSASGPYVLLGSNFC